LKKRAAREQSFAQLSGSLIEIKGGWNDNVPAVLLPFFYFFSYGCAAVCLVYAILVHFTSKITLKLLND